MKDLWLIVIAIAFFIVINTSNFWEGLLGLWTFPTYLLLGIIYLILLIYFIRQFIIASKEKSADKHRVLTICVLLIVLSIVVIKPYGMINYDNFQGKDLLIAQQEGAANSTTTIKLKKGGTFLMRFICFGVTDVRGKYSVKDDTIYFEYGKKNGQRANNYEYAVLKMLNKPSDQFIGTLLMFKNKTDTVGYPLRITKNEIKKRPITPPKPQ